jgi:hypothetical protein
MAAREVIDRTDGKVVQAIDYRDVPATNLTNPQLHAIAAGVLAEADLLAQPPRDGKARNS